METTRMRAAKLGLILLALTATVKSEEQSSNSTREPYEPTRQKLYAQFAQELQMIAGAEPYIKEVYDKTADSMRDLVSYTLLAKMQNMMDSVKEHAEDVWMTAEDEGNTVIIEPCVKGKDGEADEVVKKGLDSMKSCVEKLVTEGQQLSLQVADIATQVGELLKQTVIAIEDCFKSDKQDANEKNDEENTEENNDDHQQTNEDQNKDEVIEDQREEIDSNDERKVNDSEEQRNKEDTEDTSEEKERVKKCLQTEAVKELTTQKQSAYKVLQPVMSKVFDTEKQAPTCIMDLFKKIEKETQAIKRNITKCVDRILREEL